MDKNSNKQKEEFARRLAEKEANKIRARAFLLDLNAPETGYYYYKRTRIASI